MGFQENEGVEQSKEKRRVMRRQEVPSSVWVGAVFGIGAGVLVSVLGFIAFACNQEVLGYSVFVCLPLLSGFVAGLYGAEGPGVIRPLGHRAKTTLAIIGLYFLVLLLFAWEGVVCCALAFPILYPLTFLGVCLGMAFGGMLGNKYHAIKSRNKALLVLVLLSGTMGAGRYEVATHRDTDVVRVEDGVVIDASPQAVWEALVALDEMAGEKPLLLKVGLPVPVSCELEAERVGAKRVCTFEQGVINQTVTVWEPLKKMAVDVDGTTLPGRHWLGFVDAGYTLEAMGEQTRLVRYSTIETGLAPRAYWEPLETMGVRAEHTYVLNHLKQLAEANQKQMNGDR